MKKIVLFMLLTWLLSTGHVSAQPGYGMILYQNGSTNDTALYFSSVSPSGHTLFYLINPPFNATNHDSLQWSLTFGGNHLGADKVSVFEPYGYSYGADSAWSHYNAPEGDVIVPSTVTDMYNNTYTVASIDNCAFANCDGITSISLPNTIKVIGRNCFSSCTNLEQISIPDSISYIGLSAFPSCFSIDILFLPNRFIRLGKPTRFSYRDTLFWGAKMVMCPGSLGWINSSGDTTFFYHNYSFFSTNQVLYSSYFNGFIEDSLFYNSTIKDTLVGCQHNATIANIPMSVTYIWPGAFRNCHRLKTLTIPTMISTINRNDFDRELDSLSVLIYKARSLSIRGGGSYQSPFIRIQKLTIGDSVLSMPANLFRDCYWLRDIKVHCPTPPTIHSSTFEGIPSNTPIEVPCHTSDTYRNAQYWRTFNIVENACVEFCMVGVENGRNVLYWNNEQEVAAYNLYRESVVAGEYELMATVPYDSASRWVDVNSRPRTRSYRYKISTIDADSNESSLSHEQKTMHLTINQGLGGRWNLQWTPYEGAEYTTYIIYRGSTLDSLVQIDIMPADGNTSYTDEEAPEGDVFYQVGIVMRNSCSSATKSASISRSNIATNSSVGINGVADVILNICSHDNQIVINDTNGEMVRVFDMMGRVVAITNGNTVSVPTTGVYMVKIGNLPARRVAVIW